MRGEAEAIHTLNNQAQSTLSRQSTHKDNPTHPTLSLPREAPTSLRDSQSESWQSNAQNLPPLQPKDEILNLMRTQAQAQPTPNLPAIPSKNYLDELVSKLKAQEAQAQMQMQELAKPKTINAVDNYIKGDEFKALSKDKQNAVTSLKYIKGAKMPVDIELKDLQNLVNHFKDKSDSTARTTYLKLFNDTKQNADIILDVERNGALRKEYIKAYEHKETKDLYYLAVTEGEINITGIPTTQVNKVIKEISNSKSISKAWDFGGINNHAAPLSTPNAQGNITPPQVKNNLNTQNIITKTAQSLGYKPQQAQGFQPFTFKDAKGKTHTATKEAQEAWVKTFGLNSLDEAYTPKIPQEISEKLGGVVKITQKDFQKIVEKGREKYIKDILPTFERPDVAFIDERNDVIFAKQIGDKLYFANVTRKYGDDFLSVTQSPKKEKILNAKMETAKDFLYTSPELRDSSAHKASTGFLSSTSNEAKVDSTPPKPKITLSDEQEALIARRIACLEKHHKFLGEEMKHILTKDGKPNPKVSKGYSTAVYYRYKYYIPRELEIIKERKHPEALKVYADMLENWSKGRALDLGKSRKIRNKLVKPLREIGTQESWNKANTIDDTLLFLENRIKNSDYETDITLREKFPNKVRDGELFEIAKKGKTTQEAFSNHAKDLQERLKYAQSRVGGEMFKTEMLPDSLIYRNETALREVDLKASKSGTARDLAQMRSDIETLLNINPIKELGTNYAEFYHDPQGAIKKLMLEKKGQVAGAFHRDDLGDITLPYGEYNPTTKKGFGLAKIIQEHGGDFDSFKGADVETRVTNALNAIVKDGKRLKDEPNNIYFLQNGSYYKMALKDDWKDENVDKWIITAFDKQNLTISKRAELDSLFAVHTQAKSSNALLTPNATIKNDSTPPQIKNDLNDYYTLDEVKKILDINEWGIESWVGKGILHEAETINGAKMMRKERVDYVANRIAENGAKQKAKREAEAKELWLKTFGLNSLDEAYTPKFSDEVKEALGGKEIKLTKEHFLAEFSERTDDELQTIKKTLDEPDIVFLSNGKVGFGKKLGDKGEFKGVLFDKNGEMSFYPGNYYSITLNLSEGKHKAIYQTSDFHATRFDKLHKTAPAVYLGEYGGLPRLLEKFKTLNKDKENGAIFEKAISVADQLGVKVEFKAKANAYNTQTNTISLADENPANMLHELIHAVTSRAISNKDKLNQTQKQAISEIEKIYNHIEKNALNLGFKRWDNVKKRGDYGLSNIHEFLAELSNKTFRNKLKKVGVFGRIVDNILHFFGFKKGKDTTETNAYEATKSALMRLLDSYDFNRQLSANGVHNKLDKAQKEKRGIYNVVYGEKEAALIQKTLDSADKEAIAIKRGFQDVENGFGMGGEHIEIRHTLDPVQSGYVTQQEVVNLGKAIRAFLAKGNKPVIETKGKKTNIIYEWEKDGVRFRVVTTAETTAHQPALPSENQKLLPNSEIITFYSDRNLNAMDFKNKDFTPQVFYKQESRVSLNDKLNTAIDNALSKVAQPFKNAFESISKSNAYNAVFNKALGASVYKNKEYMQIREQVREDMSKALKASVDISNLLTEKLTPQQRKEMNCKN